MRWRWSSLMPISSGGAETAMVRAQESRAGRGEGRPWAVGAQAGLLGSVWRCRPWEAAQGRKAKAADADGTAGQAQSRHQDAADAVAGRGGSEPDRALQRSRAATGAIGEQTTLSRSARCILPAHIILLDLARRHYLAGRHYLVGRHYLAGRHCRARSWP